MGSLYRLSFPSGKSYIGITTRRLSVRWAQHVRDARKGVLTRVQSAIRKYGPENVRVEELVRAQDLSYLYEMERRAIVAFGTKAPLGYNRTDGGEGVIGLPPDIMALMQAKRVQTMMADPALYARWRAKLMARWTPEALKEHAAQARARYQGEGGQVRRSAHGQKMKAFWEKEEAAARMRAVHVARCAKPSERRRMSAATKEQMADPAARLHLGLKLSQHAGARFQKGRKPRRGRPGSFLNTVWDQIPEEASYEELFALGFRGVKLTKALRDGNLIKLSSSGSGG